MTLSEARTLFLLDRESFCSQKTVFNYNNTLKYFFDYLCVLYCGTVDNILIESISLQDLQKYSVFLSTKRKTNVNASVSGGLSSRTRKNYLKDIRCFFNFLVDNEYIYSNPSEKLKLPRSRQQPIEPLTKDEVYIIQDCFSTSTFYGVRDMAIIRIMLDAGLRSGEVQRLHLNDIHLDSNYLSVYHSKGDRGRNVPLTDRLVHDLRKYIDIRKSYSFDSEYLFVNRLGGQITQNTIKGIFDRLKVKSGVKRLYPHLLRHTFATSFILAGGNLEFLRIYLGHCDIGITQRYLHIANNLRFMDNIYKLDSNIITKTY